MTLQIGQVLNNRYRIVQLIAVGGFGTVYRAWDMNLNMACAVKENLDHSPEAQKQFTREASLLAQLTHPNLPRVIDHFVEPGQGQYLVMDFIAGDDLETLRNKNGGKLSDTELLPWIEQVCSALAYLHNQTPPVIHRDIKPANIRITPQGQAVLVDFGIARQAAGGKTTRGARAVTPGFSPPEQYTGTGTDPRSDIYAFGATTYTLLTGVELPESIHRMLAKNPTQPPHLLNADVAPTVSMAVLRAIQPDPEQRFSTVEEFRKAIAHTTVAAPAPKRSSRMVFVMILLALLTIYTLQRALTPEPVSTTPVVSGSSISVSATPTTAEPVVAITVEGPAPATRTDPAPTETPAWTIGSERQRKKDGMTQVYVPQGTFLMGTDPEDNPAQEYSTWPARTVTLDAFWIDQTEVTNAQYAKCVNTGKCTPPKYQSSYTHNSYYLERKYADYPVVWVTWDQASGYCTAMGARLPTEAEWEKAARGTDGRIYPWGNQEPKAYEFFSERDTMPVGSYPNNASPYGVLDMAGNVWEWVSDWMGDDFQNAPFENPTGPEYGEYHVLRGGSWVLQQYGKSVNQNAVTRASLGNRNRWHNTGFRCAAD